MIIFHKSKFSVSLGERIPLYFSGRLDLNKLINRAGVRLKLKRYNDWKHSMVELRQVLYGQNKTSK